MQIPIERVTLSPALNLFQFVRLRVRRHHRLLIRATLSLAIAAGILISVPSRGAQDTCVPQVAEGCFTAPKRDIAFILDRSGSIALRGQAYNIAIQGVLRALRDPTAIPRDGSIAVSIITFAEAATIVVPLTEINSSSTAENIAAKVEALTCPVIGTQAPPCPFGGTSYTSAILTSDVHMNQNRREGARRVLLMSTDGEPDDPDLGVEAANNARVAALISGIVSELDVILLGLEDPALIATNKAKVDQIVFPQPPSDLPGATMVLQGGEATRPGATTDSADFEREANEFAELTRGIIRSDVAPVSLVVTTAADTAPGAPSTPTGSLSLRQAIELANCNGGKATITFAEAVTGETISPIVPLPALTASDVTIDGCEGEDCDPGITIDGADTDVEKGEAHPHGLLIRSGRNTVRGLHITNFPGAGIAIDRLCPSDSVGRNTVEHNLLDNNQQAGILAADTLSEGRESFNVRNTFSENTISATDTPIDLNGDGPTANDTGDPDPGANTLLNFADTLTVSAADETVNVSGQLDGPTVGGAIVEIFAVTEFAIVEEKLVIHGVSFLESAMAAANGSFSATGVATSPTGIYTVTVTDEAGNTSEVMSETGDTKPAGPEADVTATVDFGAVSLNQNPPPVRPVVITNTGTAPLIVTNCSIIKCNSEDRDDTSRFTITGCPTTPINPGESVTVNVTINPTVCGDLRACLSLTTNNPKQPTILVPITATVITIGSPAAVVTLQGGASQLEFGPVTPRGKPRKVKSKNTRLFTVDNPGCGTLSISIASILRTTDAGRIADDDDSDFFVVSRVNSSGADTPVTPGAMINIGPLGRVTFRVLFQPVIPVEADCPGNPSGLSANEVLPDVVRSQITITQLENAPAIVNLVGRITTPAKLINPCSPNAPPLVTLIRSGDQFTVSFSAYDSNLSLSRASYQFLDSAGRLLSQTFDIDLAQPLADRNLVKGQSVTISQAFDGGSNRNRIHTVVVTVSDGETTLTAASGEVILGGAALSLRTSKAAAVRLPPVIVKKARRE
jgi:hypothetical protein